MYTSFYNLREKPFDISSDPAFMWLGKKHRKALVTLRYGVLENRGFLLLTGAAGTGKTTVINTLIENLGDDIYHATVPDPQLPLNDFFDVIAQSFHIDEHFESKSSFLFHFGWFLEAADKQKKKVLLIIDEAQLLSQTLLEEIRLLSNINRDGNHLLNILLAGQNEFNATLNRPENQALAQRFSLNYQLKPLSGQETEEYILHRLKVAGADRAIFSSSAIQLIHAYSGGIPRKINILCDHCLLTGYVKEQAEIDIKIVKTSLKNVIIPKYSKSFLQAAASRTVPDTGAPPPHPHAVRTAPGRRVPLGVMVLLALSIVVNGAVLSLFFFPEQLGALYHRAGLSIENRADTAETTPTVNTRPRPPEPAIPQIEENQAVAASAPAPDGHRDGENLRLEANEPDVRAYSAALPKTAEPESSPAEGTTNPAEPSRGAGSDLPLPLEADDSGAHRSAEIVAETAGVTEARAVSAARIPEDVPAGSLHPPVTEPDDTERRSAEVQALIDEKTLIRFAPNSLEFSDDDSRRLADIARAIKEHPAYMLRITGHTDSVGSDRYNSQLSLSRASMIKSYLIGNGARAAQIIAEGKGSSDPVAENDTETGRYLNRRVEIEFIKPLNNRQASY